MRSGTIAFLLGALLLAHGSALPDPFLCQLLPIAVGIALASASWRVPALFAAGFLWFLFQAQLWTQGQFPTVLEGRDLVLQGTVASLPDVDTRRARFEFEVDSVTLPEPMAESIGWHGVVQLSWYRAALSPRPGERWKLTARLKRPHGYRNPGGFDYERWLFQRGIQATGYVRDRAANQRLGLSARHRIDRVRQELKSRIGSALPGHVVHGMTTALAIGSRDGISADQWAVLRGTGTSHLMAISGLHVGLVAGFVFGLVRWLWGLPVVTLHLVPAGPVAAGFAGLAAVVYAVLAGFTVPTQRAVIMVWVVMWSIMSRRRVAPTNSLALALLIVVVMDPASVLAVGFWLSFGAVAVILFSLASRSSPRSWYASAWARWGRIQFLIAIGMAPLSLVLLGQQSLVSPIANAIAVPWVSVLVVPGVLLGTALSMISPGIGAWLLGLGADALAIVFAFLSFLAEFDLLYRTARPLPWWAVLVAILGFGLLFAPRGVPGRWLGVIGMLPLVFLPPRQVPPGGVEFTLLDVGQGLAAVVRTANHVLVYDTGPRFGSGFDAGGAVVVPFLRSHGIVRIDTLLVSHADNDHAGGLATVLEQFPVGNLIANLPDPPAPASPCAAGLRWRWDGVEFEVLHPAVAAVRADNDQSCVLRIRSPGGVILLPGDIEVDAERALTRRYANSLDADVLIAPHHGSRTSSSAEFLDLTQPRFALFAVGYRNRFGFPHDEVRARYEVRDVRWYDSANDGAIRFLIVPGEGLRSPDRYRSSARRFWHHP